MIFAFLFTCVAYSINFSLTDSIKPSLLLTRCVNFLFLMNPFFQIIMKSQQLPLCRMDYVELLPAHRYIVVMFSYTRPSEICASCVSKTSL